MSLKGNPLVRILSSGRENMFWLWLSGIFSLSDVATSIMVPVMFKRVVDLISEGSTHGFIKYVAIIIFLLFMGTINVYFRKLSSARFSASIVKKLRDKTVYHLQRLPFNIIKTHHSGDIASRVNDDMDSIKKLFAESSDFLYQPLVFIFAVVYGFVLSWKLLLATISVLILAMALNSIVTNPLSGYSSKLQKLLAKASSLVQETTKGIYIIKSFNLQTEFKNRYKLDQDKIYETEMEITKKKISVMIISILLLVVPILLINLYGGRLTFVGSMTIGEFTAFLAIISYLTNPVNRLIGLITNYKIAKASAERIQEVLDYPVEISHMTCDIEEVNQKAVVEFNKVSFEYGDNKEILSDISFKLSKNQTIALVGPSGGKSTIANLLCGFFDVQKGEIYIHGKKMTKDNLPWVRKQISLVSQDIHIYPKTVAENIGLGKLGSTNEEIVKAAKMANAHEFIINLPNGYDTLVSEGGSNLSGGQRQRIAIARGILKDSPILLPHLP